MKTFVITSLMILGSLALVSGFVLNFRGRKGPAQIYQSHTNSRPSCIWIFLYKWKHMLEGPSTMPPPTEPTDGDGSENGGDAEAPEPEEPEPETPPEAEELVKVPISKKVLKKSATSTTTSVPEMSISEPGPEAASEAEDLVKVPMRKKVPKKPGTSTTVPEESISQVPHGDLIVSGSA